MVRTYRVRGRRLSRCGWLSGVLAMLVVLGACQRSPGLAPATPAMRIGADSVSAPLAESFLNVYESELMGSLLTLETSSREAILSGVMSGELDAAILFHPLEEQTLFDTPVGYVPLTIIAPAGIGVDTLTRENLRGIFTGRIASWSEVGGPDLPIQVIAGVRGTSERLAFDNLVMGDYPITSAARLAMDSRASIDLVSQTQGGIGYGVSSALPESTVALPIDGIPAKLEEAQDRRYPLVSAVVFISKQEPEGQMRAFLDWILGDEGQEVVRRHMLALSD
jgi:phosphate transport system substrate-binding protein